VAIILDCKLTAVFNYSFSPVIRYYMYSFSLCWEEGGGLTSIG